MNGFGQHTQNYDTKPFQRPFYRRAGGQDPIKPFVQTSGMNYVKNADTIRNMRFRRSNEYNLDTAIRTQREDLISKTFYENKNSTDLSGLQLGLQLSHTGKEQGYRHNTKQRSQYINIHVYNNSTDCQQFCKK